MSMYKPVQTGIPREVSTLVDYQEFSPSDSLIKDVVYCFWSLGTATLVSENFDYLVLPDGCIDIVFDVSKVPEYKGALIMTPSVVAETIQIRSNSAYIGIRLFPGAWCADPVEIVGATRLYDSLAGYDFVSAAAKLRRTATSNEIAQELQSITHELIVHNIAESSRFTHLLLSRKFLSVQDMMRASGYSRRQLQRILFDSIGYSPHDFIKIMRFQYALGGQDIGELFFDQSHFIRECKRITGLTPAQLRARYELMSDLSNT